MRDGIGESYEFGGFRLDVGERKLERIDGAPNGSLPEKAFQTLAYLVRNSGTLLTKEELISAVWPDTAVEENNLNKAIHAIRHWLGEEAGDQRYIETVPKHGYRFVADVKRLDGRRTREYSIRETTMRSPAYELYLRGKVKGGSVDRDETEAAVRLLEEAIAIDPNFAEALAQLARAYIRMAFNFRDDAGRKRFLENAEVAIEGALDLKPDLAEGHFARGLLLWTHPKGFPHEQAIRSYKHSLESNPTADETLHQLSMVYGHIGLLDEALETVRKALDINPNNTMARFRVSNYLAWQCRFDEALQVLKTVPVDVSPFLVERVRSEVYVQLGQLDKAEAIVDEFLRKQPVDEGGSFRSVKALILAKRGDRDAAVEAIQNSAKTGEGYGHFHHTAYNLASACAALNEPIDAVKWLEAAADDGFPCYSYFEHDPNLDNIREDPRFIELMSVLYKQWMAFKQLA